jgi:hypothetical protein
MSKAISYYDWEKQLRSHSEEKPEKSSNEKNIEVNSLGVSEGAFKKMLQKWKESNL